MHDQPGAQHLSPSDPYLTTLAPEDRASYGAASPDIDLCAEIRLMRAVLTALAEDLLENHKSIATAANVLVRMVTFQARLLGGEDAAEPASSSRQGMQR